MLLVVARLPQTSDGSARADAAAAAARVTGLALADVRARLAGTLPRLLMVEPEPERARTLAGTLEADGFVILNCDARLAPNDDDRLIARGLHWEKDGLKVLESGGRTADREADDDVVTQERGEDEGTVVPPSAVAMIQKTVRPTVEREAITRTTKRIDLTRALLTGGLVLTKKVETKSLKTTTRRDAFVVLHRNDGGRDIVIYERRVDYRFLGAALQPSSARNFGVLIDQLRAWAPRAAYDDRASVPGYLSQVPSTAAAPVDLALWWVWLAHLRGAL